MKIDITTINTDYFVVRPVEIANETCSLVFPKHIGCKWNRENLILRSSIWNSEGELVSASFPKFFNWGEQEELSRPPKNVVDMQMIEKLDGSTLIVSQYNFELVVRTRGTANAYGMKNAHELDILKEKYPRAFNNSWLDQRNSLLFEWESPENRIVIKHDEVDMKLIGMIKHEDYSLGSQYMLDDYAEVIGVKRPRWYDFGSISDMKDAVSAMKGVEGVCVYTKGGQVIHKLKGAEYLAKHRLKNELGTFSRVVDFYFTQDRPTADEFHAAVEEAIDIETADEIRGEIERIVAAMAEVDAIVVEMNEFVNTLEDFTRRRAANEIKQAYGNTNRCAFAFKLLDGKELGKDMLRKLIDQILE